ncbi:MAG TPA: hypothetical protein VI636_09410 [Candidatus Angelobacter sp.]
MSLLNGKWIEVFRAGSYGDKGNYTEADIDRAIRNFQPSQHEPPVVIGHPEHNAPAYGWVDKLKRVGNTMFAMFRDVPEQFEEMLRSGRFKKRSVSFYTTPDGPVLRHVGFLGAMPPEVKGLTDVKFRDGQCQAIEFNEEDEMESTDGKVTKKKFKKALQEFFAEHFTFGSARSSIEGGATQEPQEFVDAIKEALRPLEQKITGLETQLAAEKSAREAAAAAAATHGHASFAEAQIKRVKDGCRWVPAFEKMGLPQVFSELAKSPTKVSFGEGDKKKEKQIAEVFADFLLALPKIVPVGQMPTHGMPATGKLIQFNEPSDPHTAVDQTSVSMAEAARTMADEKKISYGDALRIVRRSSQDAPNGGIAAGAV